MTATFTTSEGTTTITFHKSDGYITKATDWRVIYELAAYPTTLIKSRAVTDGRGTYGVEYYYRHPGVTR